MGSSLAHIFTETLIREHTIENKKIINIYYKNDNISNVIGIFNIYSVVCIGNLNLNYNKPIYDSISVRILYRT